MSYNYTMKLEKGSRWRGTGKTLFVVQDTWYQDGTDLWVKYTNENGKEFTCRAEAFVNRFSYTIAS